MQIYFHGGFIKQLKKKPTSIQTKFFSKLKSFENDQFLPELNNHSLSGKYSGCRSINITGDIRALYVNQGGVAKFIAIGSHSELYG